MNKVELTLLENIDKPDSLFVFPTDIAVSRWADHLLRLRKGGSISMDKFIAWDTFKQSSISSRVKDKKCVPGVLRKLFISALIRENADLCSAGKQPIFESIIMPEWAALADSHTNWLASLLPQLGIWLRKVKEYDTGEDRDLLILTERYKQFLESQNLFEPAWETPPFQDTGKECFIFFSDSLSDFTEYKELLEESKHVRLINPPIEEVDENENKLFYYTNSRSEITEAALYIQALHDSENVSWSSICVSIPEDKHYGPYLIREFENRNIPFIKQSGAPLASFMAGKLFTCILACASENYSFSSIIELLLNQHLPWEKRDEIKKLIDFGINNNCISSWPEEEEGKKIWINVWEDAFKSPYRGISADTKKFFYDLRNCINAMYTASSFSEIRKQYFVFRSKFFNMEKVSEDANTILSRCISELMYLTEIEKNYPDIKILHPYSFFTTYLEDVKYLAQQTGRGVAILPYRTAASAPFDCHIILGSSQDVLTTVFEPLTFLPMSRRGKLGILKRDASNIYIQLHKYNSRLPAAFFCSEDTFEGYTIPHSSLEASSKPIQRYDNEEGFKYNFAPDLYRTETAILSSLGPTVKQSIPVGKFHRNQKNGFNEWQLRRKASGDLTTVLSAEHPLMHMIKTRLSGRDKLSEVISVSSSSLTPYYECPHKWLFERVLELKNIKVETSLMSNNTRGDVFHSIISLFLNSIKNNKDSIPKTDNVGTGDKPNYRLPGPYLETLKKNIETVFSSFPMLPKGPNQEMSMLTTRLMHAQKEAILFKMEKFLIAFSSYFSGCKVIAAESGYNNLKGFYNLTGKVDCILEEPTGVRLIVDFKSKEMPKLSYYTGDEGLKDFQLPMYLRLAQAESRAEVKKALFFSIIDTDPSVLFGSIKNNQTGENIPEKESDSIIFGSEKYYNIMDEFDEKAEKFAKEVTEGGFPCKTKHSAHCYKCNYSKVCRTVYKICNGEFYGS
ncbi:MAG: PD-(D/E)XK nuclease family protein [Treponema sp.]|nr:PD-(D/E)XK nuclease family protein [Treponema sp.]